MLSFARSAEHFQAAVRFDCRHLLSVDHIKQIFQTAKLEASIRGINETNSGRCRARRDVNGRGSDIWCDSCGNGAAYGCVGLSLQAESVSATAWLLLRGSQWQHLQGSQAHRVEPTLGLPTDSNARKRDWSEAVCAEWVKNPAHARRPTPVRNGHVPGRTIGTPGRTI